MKDDDVPAIFLCCIVMPTSQTMSHTTVDALYVPPIFTLTPYLYTQCRNADFAQSVLYLCETREIGDWGGDAINRLLHLHQFNSAYREQTRRYLERLLARYNEE